jgi:hypothetical protein
MFARTLTVTLWSVLTVLKAYVVWQSLTFVMTLRPVSPCILTVLSEASFSRLLGSVRLFCSKDHASTLSPLTTFQNSLTLGTSPTLIVPFSLFTTFFWVLYDPVNAQHLNSFWIPLYTYLPTQYLPTSYMQLTAPPTIIRMNWSSTTSLMVM